MKKLDNKGFTLVELLAVMVVLALLMVIAANVALPALDKSRRTGLVTYAGRLTEKAQELFMLGTAGAASGAYSVEQLMGSSATESYKGSITVAEDNGNYTFTVKDVLFDVNNGICIPTNTKITPNTKQEDVVKNCSSFTKGATSCTCPS